MRAAIVDADGGIHARSDCPTEPERGIDDAAGRLLDMIQPLIDRARPAVVRGIGISSAGPIDPREGIYNHPPNLTGWHGRSMKPALAEATGLPVLIGHDAHIAALAESRFGAAVGASEVVYVTVSTGIGGGMISNGQPVNGAHGLAGEIGHLIIDPQGPSCNGGCHGCLEVFASGGGAAREAKRRIQSGEETRILDLAGGDPEAISGQTVYEAAGQGDRVAAEIVERGIDALATGLTNLLAAFDPDVLIVGGSVVQGLARYWGDLMQRVASRGLLRFRDGVPIVTSELDDDAGLLGAAILVLELRES